MRETPTSASGSATANGKVPTNKGDSGAEAEIDTGKPIAELASLRHVPGKGFFGRVRRRIERRELGTQVIELGWRGPVLVLVEWLDALFASLGADRSTSRDDPDES